MLTRISAVPKNYEWGSRSAIPTLLGIAPDGRPQAELWLGAHPDSTTTLVDAVDRLPDSLNEWIATDPATALGDRTRLPFLLKLLAAEKPLSLQAHPTLEHARAGYADEDARGIPRDSPARNYKDEWHKPELMVALQDGFRALCGFRPIDRTLEFLEGLSLALHDDRSEIIVAYRARLRDDGLEATVRSALLTDSAPLVDALVSAARAAADTGDADAPWLSETRLLHDLDTHYPGDTGIAVAALLNYVELLDGQALYLPAGNIHAYVGGLGIEIMAASDNVLRGGLTGKAIDVPELLAVLDFSTMPPPLVESISRPGGYQEYATPLPDFRLLRVDSGCEAVVESAEAAIVIAVAADARVSDATDDIDLRQGEALFATPSPSLTVRSAGTTFIATSR